MQAEDAAEISQQNRTEPGLPLQDARPGTQPFPVAATQLCLVAAALGRAPKDEGV